MDHHNKNIFLAPSQLDGFFPQKKKKRKSYILLLDNVFLCIILPPISQYILQAKSKNSRLSGHCSTNLFVVDKSASTQKAVITINYCPPSHKAMIDMSVTCQRCIMFENCTMHDNHALCLHDSFYYSFTISHIHNFFIFLPPYLKLLSNSMLPYPLFFNFFSEAHNLIK